MFPPCLIAQFDLDSGHFLVHVSDAIPANRVQLFRDVCPVRDGLELRVVFVGAYDRFLADP